MDSRTSVRINKALSAIAVLSLLLIQGCTCGPDTAAAEQHYEAGEDLYEQGLYNESIAEFNMSIHFDPQYAKAYYARGGAYCFLHKYELSIKDEDEAIRLDPQYADAYYGRAISYYHLGDYDSSLKDYNEAIRLDPELARAYYGRCCIYYDREDYEGAVEECNESIRLEPDFAKSYALRALIYTYLYMDAEAQQDIDMAVSLGYDATMLDYAIVGVKAERNAPDDGW